MTLIEQAIQHYTYGITHDIFSEPVTSYATLAADALEKQIPKKVINKGYFYGYACHCPICNKMISGIYSAPHAKYCSECGQALDWGETNQ